MRLILATVLVVLAGAVGWFAGVRLGPAEDWSAPVDAVVTGSTESDPQPIRRVSQPVRVIVAQEPAVAPVEPTDLV